MNDEIQSGGSQPGHAFRGNQYTTGQKVTVNAGSGSADGKFTGHGPATIINPHSNAHEVDTGREVHNDGRLYDKQGHRHMPTATVEIDRSGRKLGPTTPLRFEAYHHQLSPISASNESSSVDAIECRAAIEISPTTTNEILFLPIGLHAITPVAGGIGRPIKVKVGPDAAAAMETQRTQLMSSGKRPYFDFNHEDGPASFWPESFSWRGGEGVIARGEWSRRGKSAVEGKDYRAFSPVFHVDNKRAENGAIVVCKETASPNMGGLVNDPAFKNLPLWAKNGEQLATPESGDNAEARKKQMETEQDIAALRAKQQELQTEVDALKASRADNQKLSQSQVELRNIELEIENAEIKARSESLQKEVTATNKRAAEAAIKAAIQRGAILPKDTKTQTELIAADKPDCDPGTF